MEKEFILSNGVRIPNIGLGTWRVPESELCEKSVAAALTAGYRHIDTASFYKNEVSVGNAVRNSGINRSEIFVTSKLWNDDHGYDETLKAFDESLKRLGLDYLDLYLIHWPNPMKFRNCFEKSNADTWRAFEKLYRNGRVRAIGISNFMPHHVDALLKTAEINPMVNQIELQPGLNRTELLNFNSEHGMVTEAWGPFRVGNSLDEPVIVSLAEKYGKTAAQITLRWHLQRGVVPLPKSVTPSRITSNIDVYDFELTDYDMRLISEIEQHEPRHNSDEIEF